MIEHLGADNIMFETDYPPPDLPLPRQRSTRGRTRSTASAPDVQRQVLQDNAAELYKVALPATV